MTIKLTGRLAMSEFNNELALVPTSPRKLGSTLIRDLFGKLAGKIKFSDGFGKSSIFIFYKTLTADTYDFNVATAATDAGWDGKKLVEAHITVNTGVTVRSTSTLIPAIDCVGLPTSSTIFLALQGTAAVIGRGGDGGVSGGTQYGPGYPGSAGGVAINAPYHHLHIENLLSTGAIAGGGGGGGGGAATYNSVASGGGGGGGAGGGLGGGRGTGQIYNGTVGANSTSYKTVSTLVLVDTGGTGGNGGEGSAPGGVGTTTFTGGNGNTPVTGAGGGGGGGGWGSAGGTGGSSDWYSTNAAGGAGGPALVYGLTLTIDADVVQDRIFGNRVKYVSSATFTSSKVISANTNNFNVFTSAVSDGWNQFDKLNYTVTINADVTVGSTAPGSYAFDTDSNFPTGSVISVINNGAILGCAGTAYSLYDVKHLGNGGDGGPAFYSRWKNTSITNNGTIAGGGGGGGVGGGKQNPSSDAWHYARSGGNGGAGIVATASLNLTNNNTIAGGGGGGSGGEFSNAFTMNGQGGGGGGGAGFGGGALGGGVGVYASNPGAAGLSNTGGNGGLGTSTTALTSTGGKGGSLGSNATGGAAQYYPSNGSVNGLGGAAVNGNSFITWTAAGTISGSLI